ncbi:MAG: hypothetical protein AB1630_05940 [bacterium]
MTRTLPGVIADILHYKGVEVEEKDGEFLDVLLPEPLSKTLNIPEYARLSFSFEKIGEGITDASYESSFFASIKGLFKEKGFAGASIPSSTFNLEKIAKGVDEKIDLRNATFRLEKTEVSNIPYLLAFFKYIAISDEKNEGILPFLLNCMNLSTMVIEDCGFLRSLEKEEEPQISEDCLVKMLLGGWTAATYIIPERLKDFRNSLERRLNRDIKRVYEYYENLKKEAERAIERKQAQQEDVEKLQNKLTIIETERGLKVSDLISQYGLSIHIEPLVAITINILTPVFWINIKRRLSERVFPFSYNPIFKQFDPLPCESCFNPSDGYYVCDDNCHIICGRCFKSCPSCGKQYCPVCHKICPRCKTIKENEKKIH